MNTQLIQAMTAGLVVAAAVDIQAFRSWKSFDDARKYRWDLAAWRWFQGATLGAFAYLGIAQVS